MSRKGVISIATVQSSLKIFDAMTGPLKSITSGMNMMISTMQRMQDTANRNVNIDKTLMAAKQQIASAEVEINKQINLAKQSQDNFNNSVKNSKQSIDTAGRAIIIMNQGLELGRKLWDGISRATSLADTMTTTRARLDLMNDGLQTTAVLQDMIMESANRSRASYQTTADAVSKMGIMAKDAFGSNQELVSFSELINKQFTIAGTSAAGIDAAMLQLTQAMASGVLRGEELNSVFEQAPTIIQTIADYLKVPIGQIRAMASEGQITSTIVKNAMLSSTDEINKKFNSMPMTFSQMWTVSLNALLQTFQPLIQTIGMGAQYIYNNWSSISPIFWGLVSAVGAYVAITAIWTAVTWLQVAANRALLASMLTNPILWIALAIGVVIGMIYKWVESVGGLRIAWMIVCSALLTTWDWVKIGFMIGVYWVMDLFNRLQLSFMTVSTNIQNFMGDMRAGVLSILQDMVNGAIDIINGFINTLNKIPGVSIDVIDQVTFGTAAQIENEAAKQARNNELTQYANKINSQIADRSATLNAMKSDATAATAARKAEISAAQAANLAKGSSGPNSFASKAGVIPDIGKVGKVGKIEDKVDISSEDLKLMRELAEMKTIQNFVSLTPTVQVTTGDVREEADINKIVAGIKTVLQEEIASSAAGTFNV